MNSTVKTSGCFKSRDLRASVQLFPFHFYSLAEFFARPKCEKLPSLVRISFASYGNASFTGFPQTCHNTSCFTEYTWCILDCVQTNEGFWHNLVQKILVFVFQLWNILVIIRTWYILSHADINKWAHPDSGDYASLTLTIHLHFFYIYNCVIPLDILHRDSSTNSSSSNSAPSTSAFVVLPYVRGVSERISRVIRNNGVKVGYKPFNVLYARVSRADQSTNSLPCCAQVFFKKNGLRWLQFRILWTDWQSLGNKVKGTEKVGSNWKQQFQSCATRALIWPCDNCRQGPWFSREPLSRPGIRRETCTTTRETNTVTSILKSIPNRKFGIFSLIDILTVYDLRKGPNTDLFMQWLWKYQSSLDRIKENNLCAPKKVWNGWIERSRL